MSAPRKNILLLIADDLGKYTGSYGVSSIQTPALDKLASEGVRFDKAFASTASCSGSRSVIYTGLHSHENGQYGLMASKTHFQTFEHIDSAPKLFNDAGYLTGILGKIHVGTDKVYPWAYREESGTRDTAWIADRAEAFFKNAKSEARPFFLTVGYVDPHRDVMTRAEFGNGGEYDKRIKRWTISPNMVELPHWLSDHPETREEFAEYYTSINRMDQGIGMLLDGLDRQGLRDDTLVVFLSDNGPPFPNSKTTIYDAGVCLPFIVRAPNAQPGIANPNLVSYIDILPTFLDWAKIPLDARSESSKSPKRLGRSILPIMNRADIVKTDEWQECVFGSHTFHEIQSFWPTRYLRNHRYKYHRNVAWRLDFPQALDLYASLTYEAVRNGPKPAKLGKRLLKDYIWRGPEELYDMENDPDEVVNLVKDPRYAEILKDLRFQLEKWQQQTGDLWLYRDSVSLIKSGRHAVEDFKLPDRWEVDTENPGLQHVPLIDAGGLVGRLDHP